MKKIWKTFLILFIIGITFSFILFFTYWITWKQKSNFYLKQTEIYFNSLIKFSSENNKYQYIKNSDENFYTIYPIKVLDRNKKTIGLIKTNNKIIVPIEKISQNFINALVATEDQYFFKHNGISLIGIARAFYNNISEMRVVQGGSTITQQLSKLLFSNQEKTFTRKINEFFTALSIEKNYTKNDILFMYSNLIYFGYNIYGVGLASKAYFGKNIENLSIPEAALLVTLISNPSFYNPYKHIENTKKKHLAVMINMYDKGFITKEEVVSLYKKFWKNPTLLPSISLPDNSFVGNKGLYVLEETRRFLAKQYGNNFLDELQGSTINTTIDIDIQSYIDDQVPKHLETLREESPLSIADKKGIESGTVVSKVNTGELLAFSGGSSFSQKNQFNRAFQAKRQVGSTIKPFLYVVGLNLKQLTPYTVFEDIPIEVEFKNKMTWDVNNFAKSYRGYLNVSDALKRSSNVVAVQVVNEIGLNNLQQFFQKGLDISYQEVKEIFADYQYSIALGAVNLTPLQLNQLYQIIANNGQREELYFISQIEDLAGNVIYKHKPKSQMIVSKEASFLIQKILTTVFTPGGSGNYVKRNYKFQSEIAGKSGTTQNNRDVWFSGFTSNLNITTWLGQDQNKSLGNKFLGGIQSGRMFGDFMQFADKLYPAENFSTDPSYNLISSPVDLLTGYLPTQTSLFTSEGLFITGTQPTKSIFLSIAEQLKIAKKKKIITPEESRKINEKYNTKLIKKEKKDFSDLLEESVNVNIIKENSLQTSSKNLETDEENIGNEEEII